MHRSATEDQIRRIYRDTIDDLYRFVSRRCDPWMSPAIVTAGRQ